MTDLLKRLNEVNDFKILSVYDREFETYGRIVEGYDFSDLTEYIEHKTQIPESGNVYVASVAELENTAVCNKLINRLYGGMDIQIGFCNGRNSTYNGFEYHKGSELNIAITDMVLVLGHTWQIRDNKFYVGDEKVFFVPAGVAIEMYQTTLHLSPCKVCDGGFKDIVVLPRGTNTPLDKKPGESCGEDALLLMKNKWVIAHKDRKPLVDQGAHIGLIGENKEVKY